MNVMLFAAPLLPLLLALAAFAGGRLRAIALRAAPWAAAPALIWSLAPTGMSAGAPWILFGATLALDATARALLFLTAVLWAIAAWYARSYHAGDPRRGPLTGFFLLTMSGNIGVVLAADAVTFYFAFALMTFAAYGLVVHAATAEARRAGRVYMVMAVAGEAMIVAGLVIAAVSATSFGLDAMARGVAESPHRHLVIGLLLGGFGIKAGALPLHVWLPLAHPVAPTPSSAVLSGCMIKAGLLGWIRFLPLGEAGFPAWGSLLIMLGLLAAFGGVLLGIVQRDPKTVLAYSSISQMGIMNVGLGIALAAPLAAPVALPAVLLYAVHHGLAKGALFLGVGVTARTRPGRSRRAALAGMIFAGLALAGAPLTSGSVAKRYLKDVVAVSPGPWPAWLDVLLPLTAVGTTALMTVLLLRLMTDSRVSASRDEQSARGSSAGLAAPWVVALGTVALALWTLPRVHPLGVDPPAFPYPALLFDATWPILAGIAIVAGALLLARRARPPWHPPEIAAGDIVVVFEATAAAILHAGRRLVWETTAQPVMHLATRWYDVYARSHRRDLVLRGEVALTRWEVGATALVLVVLAFIAALAIAHV